MFSFNSFLESAILVIALTIDTFIAFTAYGCRKIRVPAASVIVVSAICTAILIVAALLGAVLAPLVPEALARGVCFAVLLLMGIARVFDSALKAWIRRGKSLKKRMRFSLSSLHFLLEVYADPETADLDDGGTLSPREATLLAAALSFDGIAAGFGVGAAGSSILLCAVMSLVLGLLAIVGGLRLGRMIADRSGLDISPLSGILLIILAFLKLS